MKRMKTYTFDELKDKFIGEIGTPKRDEYEKAVKEEIQAYHIGEAIKQARIAKNLTQEELGNKVGVQKSHICKIERGRGISLSTMLKLFDAMDIRATLDLGAEGKIALY